MAVLQAPHLLPDLVAEAASVVPVDLHQVSAWVANVQLDLAARELVQVRAHGFDVVNASRASCPENRLEVVDRECEMVVGGGGARALEQMELQVAYTQPLNGEPEVGCVDCFSAEDLDVELDRMLEVTGHDADVIDVRLGHRLTIARRDAAANAAWAEC